MISLKRLKLLAAAMLVIGTGWLAVGEIRERGALVSKQLAMAAKAAMERGEHDLAMLLALEGLPAGKGQVLAMDSQQARFALEDARELNRLAGIYPKGENPYAGHPNIRPLPAWSEVRRNPGRTEKLQIHRDLSGETFVHLVNIATNEVIQILGPFADGVNLASFSPNGEFILLGLGARSSVSFRLAVYHIPSNEMRPNIRQQERLSPDLFAFSDDGKTIFLVDTLRNDIIAWNLLKDEEVMRLRGHEEKIVSLQTRPGWCTLMSASQDNTIRLWPACDHKAMNKEFEILRTDHEELVEARFTYFGYSIQSIDWTGESKVWKTFGGLLGPSEARGRRDWKDGDDFAQVGPEAALATGLGYDGYLDVMIFSTFHTIARLNIGENASGFARFSPSGRRILTLANGSLKVWQIIGEKEVVTEYKIDVPLATISTRDAEELQASFIDENRIFVGPNNNEFGVWNIEENNFNITEMSGNTQILSSHPSGKLLGYTNPVKGVEARENAKYQVLDLAVDKMVYLEGVKGEGVSEFWFSDDGQFLVGRGDKRETSHPTTVFWDVKSGQNLGGYSKRLPRDQIIDTTGFVAFVDRETRELWAGNVRKQGLSRRDIDEEELSVALAVFDRKHVLISRDDDVLVLADLSSGQTMQRFFGHSDTVHSAVLTQGGSLMLTTSADGDLRVWDVKTGEPLHIYHGHQNARGGRVWYDMPFEQGEGISGLFADYVQNGVWSVRMAPDDLTLIVGPSALGFEVWRLPLHRYEVGSACVDLPANRNRLTSEEYARYGIEARSQGPCDRHGPLSPEFWGEKAEGFGLLH